MAQIKIPYNFEPRKYQLNLLNALDDGYKRAIITWNRRSGKDKVCFNYMVRKAVEEIGTYYYFLPTYSQAKRVIWDNIDNDGFKMLDHIPQQIIKSTNATELKIELINGSIIQLIGADEFKKSGVGANPVGVVFSEYSITNPEAWKYVSPILAVNEGWAIFNFTPRGMNHAYTLLQQYKENPKWFVEILTNDETQVLKGDALEEEKRNNPQDFFEQEYYCFTPDTDIITIDGIKKINEIKSGDFVLTHSNRFRKVLGVNEREYEGGLNIIETYGSNRPLKLTPEHRVRITNDGVNYEWVEAKNITSKDRLTFPKLLPRSNKIIDFAMAKLIAWFVVEGSARKSQVTFTLNENEIEYAEEIKNCLKLVNGGAIHEIVKGGSRQIINNNADLVEFLISQCGSGALNKKIPFQIISGYEQLFYDILIKGDGHFSKERDSFVTISETLGYQLQLLANMLGYTSGVTFRKNKGISYIQGRKVNIHNSIQVRIQKTKIKSGAKLKYHKYSVSSSLKSNKVENYSGKVYNIEVEIDNSYTANGRVVHNCKFIEGAGQFFKNIRENLIEEENQPEPNHRYQMGVDLAKYQDYTVITVIDLNTFRVHKQERFNQIDWVLQKAKIEAMYRRYYEPLIYIDSTGVGDPIYEDLMRQGLRVEGFKFNENSRKDLLNNLAIKIEQNKIKLPETTVLVGELQSFHYELSERGKIQLKVPEGLHDDTVMSLALACWNLPDNPLPLMGSIRFLNRQLEEKDSQTSYE